MRNLDVTLVHANAAIQVYQALAKRHTAIETPIWCGMLANHCRTRGFNCEIVDCEAEQLTPQECTERIQYSKPRLVAFVVYGQQPSASTQNMAGAIAYSEHLKQHAPETRIVFLGGHVAAVPLEVLNYQHIDFICQNEGVYTLSNLLAVTDYTDANALRTVAGLGWKEAGVSILNPIGAIVPQDRLQYDLPGVAWDLLPPFTRYRTSGWHSWPNAAIKSPFASLYTSLGCSSKCSFCMINIINRTRIGADVSAADSAIFRYWPPEFIIKQFDHFAEQGVTNVKIADEMFVLKPQHFMEVCRLIKSRKYSFNIWAYSRIDTCKQQYLETLRAAGVQFLALGIESPDQVVRKDVVKGSYKEVKIQEVIQQIRDAGISVVGNFIVGLPKDTAESIKYNVDFAKAHRMEYYNIYSAMAYPGSPLHIEARSQGWELPDRYAGYSQHSYWTQPLPTETLTAAEVLRARDAAWTEYFTDPAYHVFLRSRFGHGAVDDVQATISVRLYRRLLGDPESTGN